MILIPQSTIRNPKSIDILYIDYSVLIQGNHHRFHNTHIQNKNEKRFPATFLLYE